MLVTYGIVIPIFLLVTVLFFWFSPNSALRKQVRLYNTISVLCAATISGGYVLYLKLAMEAGSDFGWWPVVSLLASMVISSFVLAVAGLVRNFIVFRRRNA